MLRVLFTTIALTGPAAAGCFDYGSEASPPQGELCLNDGICTQITLETICSNQTNSFAIYAEGWRVDFDMTSDAPGVVSFHDAPLGPWDLAHMSCTDRRQTSGAQSACEFMSEAIFMGSADL